MEFQPCVIPWLRLGKLLYCFIKKNVFCNFVRDAETSASLNKLQNSIQRCEIVALHERKEYCRAVEERTEAEKIATYPTPDDDFVGVAEEVREQKANKTVLD